MIPDYERALLGAARQREVEVGVAQLREVVAYALACEGQRRDAFSFPVTVRVGDDAVGRFFVSVERAP